LRIHGSSWGAHQRGRVRGRGAGGRLLGEEAPWGRLLGAAGYPCGLSVCVERLCCSLCEEEEQGERRGKMKRKEKKRKRKKYGKNFILENFQKIKDNL
jgi:hypothetical protein